MKMKQLAGCGFLLNTIFFATYYSVAKEALSRIEPIVFTFFEMVSLAPFALVIILCSWRQMTRAVIRRGVLLGSTLCLALFTIAIALKYTTATSTAFFPALNGFLAAIIAWMLFREPTKPATWWAGFVSLSGAALLIFSSSMGNLRGTLIAFLGGLFYTAYVFLCDHEQKNEQEAWPLFGIELLSTAIWACLVVLLFGDWQAVHPQLPKDIGIVFYVSIACTFVPTLISVLLQKYISPVTVSFIYILEPVLGTVIAYLYLHETLPVLGYVGGGLVVVGALINTWGTIGQSAKKRSLAQLPGRERVRGSWVSTVLYPGVSSILGAALLFYLGGFPPASWREALQAWPQVQAGQGGTYVTLLLVQAAGWLVAWVSVLLMGWLALYHQLQRFFQPDQARRRWAREELRAAPLAAPVQEARSIERPVLPPTPTRRTRTTVRLPEYQQPADASQRLPERQTQAVQPGGQPVWHGNPVWNTNSQVSGHGRVPFTEPLPPEITPPLKRRASLAQQQAVKTPFLESLDA